MDLVNSIGNRVEINVEPFGAELLHEFEHEIIHIQHAYGYIPEWREMDKYLIPLSKAKIITLHEIPLWPHEHWYDKVDVNFIVGNEMMERELLKLGVQRDKLTVIPHGATIWNPLSKEESRSKLGLNILYKHVIVQPGFISWGKGISEVIYAASRVPDTYVVFAGGVHPNATPQDKRYLLQCMKGAKSIGMENRVHFVGSFLSEQELDLWMAAADILILNHQFVYGSYSASAMAKRILCAERPIIMSHDVRLSEYIDKEHCIKVVAEDIKQVESAINKLINNEEYGETLAKNAREYAIRHSWKNMADRHLELYEKVLNA